MGVFDNREPLGLAGMLQGGIPIAPQQQMSGIAGMIDPRSPQMMEAQQKALQPKAFEQGGRGWQVLGVIGDALQTFGGGHGTYVPMQMQMRDLAQQRQDRDAEIERKRRQREFLKFGNDGIAAVSEADGVNILREPTPEEPKMGETERLIQAWSSLPDSDPRKPMYAQAVRGFQYSQPGIQAIAQAANARAGAVAAHRAPPRAGGRGGSSKLPGGFILD